MPEALTHGKPRQWPDDDVILYDGVCVFCSRWVRFVVARDTAAASASPPIQSAYGTRLAQAFGIDPEDPDTNAVIHGGVAYFKSDAALTVLSQSAGMALGARVVRGAASRCATRVYNLVAQEPLPDFREVRGVFRAGCGDEGEGDGIGVANRSKKAILAKLLTRLEI